MIAFTPHSLATLGTVQPPLQRLAQRALELYQIDDPTRSFDVVQGARTVDQQMRLFGRGRTAAQLVAKGVPAAYAQPALGIVTWTLRSNHLGGQAIDVCPLVRGIETWDNDGRLGLWPPLEAAFKAASVELGIPVYCGADFPSRQQDRPHFALVPG